jgi:flagellar basal-body rod modification protein FlgD
VSNLNLNGIAVANSATTSTGSSAASQARKNVNQEMFLQLLVAQLKNQDPLQPQEGTEFISQLAQFSSLEQLTTINQQLGELLKKQ